MIKLKRVEKTEEPLVIYHYLYGELIGYYGERFLTWTEDKIKKEVLDVREKYTTWDFKVFLDDKGVGLVSFTDIDYESLNAMLKITIIKSDEITNEVMLDILCSAIKFAFHQIGLVRLEGVLSIDDLSQIIQNSGFIHEVVIRKAAFRNGTRNDINIYGVLKEEFEEGELGAQYKHKTN